MRGPRESNNPHFGPEFMLKGTVKFFNKAKGFGFITPDNGNKEIFLPASVVPATDAARLKTGQRVSFEQAPDTKGPKVVALTFLDEAPRLAEAPAARPNITVFHASADPASADVIEMLIAQGHQPRLVEYMAAPPPPDELRRLSLLLNGADQNLVRRYDPLFLELQLDDRFITESEFWTAVSEHPQLINGPILAAANKVRICRSAGEVRDFLGLEAETKPAAPKALSPRIAAMMLGIEPPPIPTTKAAKAKAVAESPIPEPAAPSTRRAAAKAKPAAPKPKPMAGNPAIKAKKAPAKTVKKAVKKVVAKPAKKKAATPAAKTKKRR